MPSVDQNLRLSWQRLAWPGEGVGQANLLMVSLWFNMFQLCWTFPILGKMNPSNKNHLFFSLGGLG
jgi:hypothetical protein